MGVAAAADDLRLAEAQAVPIAEIADRLAIGGLVRAGAERVGPCPKCGGRDRFGINLHRNVWNCRKCGGGDGIELVRHVMACSFPDALDWLVGRRELALDPAEAERRRKAAEAANRKREADANYFRRRAIEEAVRIWTEGRDPAGTPVEDYLARRGLGDLFRPWPPKAIRFHPALRYMWRSGQGQPWQVAHEGPAMIAAIQGPDDKMRAVHRTWLDLSKPKGKAEIWAPDGTRLDAKTTRGHKKGGTIRLMSAPRPTVLVMGEGIETTASAAIRDVYPDAAYWAGVDLGNMGGRALRGKGLKYAGQPDMDDTECFVPPPNIRRLIFIKDGDSDPRATQAALECGLRRAMRRVDGLRGQIVEAGAGMDLNDVLLAATKQDQEAD